MWKETVDMRFSSNNSSVKPFTYRGQLSPEKNVIILFPSPPPPSSGQRYILTTIQKKNRPIEMAKDIVKSINRVDHIQKTQI